MKTLEAVMKNGTIDVHCHLFNGRFAFEELLEIGWRWIHDEYPCKDGQLHRTVRGVKLSLPPFITGMITYVASLFETITRNPDGNYKYELKCYKESRFPQKAPLITVPLMMDIYFLFDDGAAYGRRSRIGGMTAAKRRASLEHLQVDERMHEPFDAFAAEMKELVLQAMSERMTAGRKRALPAVMKRKRSIEKEIDTIIGECKAPREKKVRAAGGAGAAEVQMTRGYRHHIEALGEIKQKNPGTVFPFLAVDPRRTGIEQLVNDHVLHGDFHGVKLYCPLGYLPSHPDLNPVFRICLDNNIPVTAHTSPGGFPSQSSQIRTFSRKKDGSVVEVLFDRAGFEKKQKPARGEWAASLFFADPLNWLEVLESPGFGKLKVNFAHFGGEENIRAFAGGSAKPGNWTAGIVELMERFDNVYADISFCPGSDMPFLIQKIVTLHPKVSGRLMFGTDYVMLMINGCGLTGYFNEYTGLPSAMLTTNAANFLKRP
jgi:predicted TIM-barrel fold metal-dependent hydrolase